MSACGGAVHPQLKAYLQPGTVAGALAALFSRAVGGHVQGSITTAAQSLRDAAFARRTHDAIVTAFRTAHGTSSDAAAAAGADRALRLALLAFVASVRPSQLPPHALFTAGCLPVFPVHGAGSDDDPATGTGNLVPLSPAAARLPGASPADGSKFIRFKAPPAVLSRQ